MIYRGQNNEYLEVHDINAQAALELPKIGSSELSLLWFEAENQQLAIDAVNYSFGTHQVVFLTEFHQVEFKKISNVRLLRFNRPFYCIATHDSEVGCKGVLYFGSSTVPTVQLTAEDVEVLGPLWKLLEREMQAHDNLQLEMLQMLLKRLLILCTRLYKQQKDFQPLAEPKMALIREFNYLVEAHFREKHTVAEYAEMLHKSPKTLSNLFKKLGDKTPLAVIQERRLLEARRALAYTSTPISEIGYAIGFPDVQTFGRFFKRYEGFAPSEFRKQLP
ncbi:MAG: helix-turn-helix domain-containing protein [Aureispira sp.]